MKLKKKYEVSQVFFLITKFNRCKLFWHITWFLNAYSQFWYLSVCGQASICSPHLQQYQSKLLLCPFYYFQRPYTTRSFITSYYSHRKSCTFIPVCNSFVVPRLSASGSTGNSQKCMFSRPTESESLGWAPAICVLTIPPGDSDA